MIINSVKTDPNKILPIRYPWARQYYKAAIANKAAPRVARCANAVVGQVRNGITLSSFELSVVRAVFVRCGERVCDHAVFHRKLL